MAKWKYFTVPHWPGTKPAVIESLSAYMPTAAKLKLGAGERAGERAMAGKVVPLRRDGGSQLTDFLNNVHRLLVGSESARELFASAGLGPEDVEIIPIAIADKKKKPIPKKYFILHPIRRIACMDPKRSDCEHKKYAHKERWFIRALQLDEEKIPVDAKLFRLAEDPRYILIRSDLLERIREAKLTGLQEQELGESL